MRVLLVGLFLVFASILYAQPGGGGPGGGGDPDAVPIGGIELLIAAGAMFGAKKWFDRGKRTN